MSILVIEDEPTLRSVVATFLRKRGYQMLDASDGGTAQAILRSDEPMGVLFPDANLGGGMNGLELAARTRDNRPDRWILVTSANPIVPDADRDLLGRPRFTKPYSARDLVDRIDKLVVHRATWGTSHSLAPKS